MKLQQEKSNIRIRCPKTGQAADRADLTKAGRSLDKHGNRQGAVYPRATGNAANKRMQGQFQLDDLLTHLETISYPNRFGGRDYFTSDGRGASTLLRLNIRVKQRESTRD